MGRPNRHGIHSSNPDGNSCSLPHTWGLRATGTDIVDLLTSVPISCEKRARIGLDSCRSPREGLPLNTCRVLAALTTS